MAGVNGQKVNAANPIGDLLSDLILSSAALMGAHGGAVGVVSACGDRLEVQDAYPASHPDELVHAKAFSLPLDKPRRGWRGVVDNEHVWCADIDDARFTDGFRSYHHEAGRRFFAHFPVSLRGETTGFLGLAFSQASPLKPTHVNAVRWMARHAGLLIETGSSSLIAHSGDTHVGDAFRVRLARLIDQLIDEMRWSDLKSTALATGIGYSTRQFHQRFVREFGYTPHAWILNRRLARAIDLLLEQHTVSHVAYRLGFVDPAHFARRFRERYGYLPSEARIAARLP